MTNEAGVQTHQEHQQLGGHVVMRDERAVNRIVALRMVPLGELVMEIDRLVSVMSPKLW